MQLAQTLIDHYRCPESFFNFELNGPLSEDEGFFRFGQSICYGRSTCGYRNSRAQRRLYDTIASVSIHDSYAALPFNPTEIIDNLRRELYTEWHRSERWAKSAYYVLRPWLPSKIRTLIKKIRLLGWRSIPFPEWPVDRTVETLREQLLLLSLQASKTDRIPFIWFWPRGARGCVVMTHDVEAASGRDACAAVMDLDDSFGIKASFQLVPGGEYEVTRDLRDFIHGRGFEVALQDLNHDGRLFDHHDEFLRRAHRINQYAREYGADTFRSAVLYRQPDWYDSLQVSIDMSIPNVAHLDPQRGGCCTTMPYFIGTILELPVTTTQDYMLFYLLAESSIDLWEMQTRMVLEKHGLVSFIVHSDYVVNDEMRSLYRDLLTYLTDLRARENLWFALPREIGHWWRLRNQMMLVKDGESWKIRGEGSDQAVLAYATNVSDRLAYLIPSAEPAN
jgi:hypothetical protein